MLTEKYHIQFSRSKTRFLDWSIGSDVGIRPAWQTAFWRPVLDASTEMVRTAFGMEYIRPQTTRRVTQKTQRESKHGSPYQRLSIFLQLPSRQYGSQNLSTPEGRPQVESRMLLTQNTTIVFDSTNDTGMTDGLTSGYEPWQDLATESSISTITDSKTLAVAAMQLLFDAIAGKWSEYILHMHGFVSALAEDIYDEPANDEPSSVLWSVSKELLQAERLLKSHIRLLETIQSELTDATGPDALKAD